jgi:uncharacterized protein
MPLSQRFHVIDVDTHIIEPPDLWTTRVPKKWGSLVPHVRFDERARVERWYMGDERLPAVGSVAQAGWKDFPPAFPPTLEEADPATCRADARLQRMDEYGIFCQVLYPNLLGFQCESFMKMSDRSLGIACVRAYNDFLAEFCSIAPERLVPVMWLPFWDLEASIAEVDRAWKIGHRGVIFGSDFSAVGLPPIGDPHWDPLLKAVADRGLSLNFHIGFAAKTSEEQRLYQKKVAREKEAFVRDSTLMFMSNAQAIATVLLSGVCARFPTLNFVSVESGASWLPFLIEALDWQWKNSGAAITFKDRELPSFYFRRQVFGSFWFESSLLREAIRQFPDNIMFETDFPHPTSLSPGPASYSDVPSKVIEDNLAGLSDDLLARVLHDTAARLYHLKSPALRPVRETAAA